MLRRLCHDTAEARAVLRIARSYRRLDDDERQKFSPRIRVHRKDRAASKESLRLHLALLIILNSHESPSRFFGMVAMASFLYLVALASLIHSLLS